MIDIAAPHPHIGIAVGPVPAAFDFALSSNGQS
jgi:hypothetical protein